MKPMICALVCFFLVLFAPLNADARSVPSNLGAGLIFIEPTGLTAKLWRSESVAYAGGVAFSLDNYLLIYGDYLYHFPNLFNDDSKFFGSVIPYFGLGAIFAFSGEIAEKKGDPSESSYGAAVRIPIGAEWIASTQPVGIFAEIVPGIGLTPSLTTLIQGAVGIRYYFP